MHLSITLKEHIACTLKSATTSVGIGSKANGHRGVLHDLALRHHVLGALRSVNQGLGQVQEA